MILRRHRSRAVRLALLATCAACVLAARAQRDSLQPELSAPIAIYSHAHASGVLSTGNPLNEKQAMRELDELLRLKKAGVRFDYILMDASWFAPGGGYRIGHTPGWPDGPDAWISKCRAAGIRPAMRFAGNTPDPMQFASAWKDSLDQDGHALSFFEGGFLPGLISALQSWYNRGIRLFQFDSINLAVATPASAARLTSDEIVARNSAALRQALSAFRRKNRDAVLLVFTSSGGNLDSDPPPPDSDSPDAHAGSRPDLTRLGAFQMLSTGEPQSSVAPQANVRRSIDIERDNRVRRIEQSGVPLQHIDSAGFTAGSLGGSGLRAWKGAFLLAMARGGWVNSVHGNLHLIQDNDASWIARVQKLFFNLQAKGGMRSFGASPGSGQPYGFAGTTPRGSVYVVVNPGQAIATLALPPLAPNRPQRVGRVQFRDAGFIPRLKGNFITLGPGQMAMVGYGAYAAPAFNFGVQQDVVIPNSIEPVEAEFHSTAPGAIEARFNPPIQGVLCVVVVQHVSGGVHASESAGQVFTLEATQSGRPIPVRLGDSENGGNGLSGAEPYWLAGEIDVNDLTPGVPVRVRFHSTLNETAGLEASAYEVVY